MSNVNFEDAIRDSTFTIIHKELPELFLNGTKFWSFHTSVHGLDFKFFKSWCQVPSYWYSFIHSHLHLSKWFFWRLGSTWMGLFVFTSQIRLNIAPQLFIKLNYIWWYWLHLQILLSPSSKLQKFASLKSKYLSLCFIQSCSLQFIQPINDLNLSSIQRNLLLYLESALFLSISLLDYWRGIKSGREPTPICRPTNPPHAFNFWNFKIYSWNRVKVCHHVRSTSILMGLTCPLEGDLVHVILRKIAFAWDVHHLFKNTLPVKVVHRL